MSGSDTIPALNGHAVFPLGQLLITPAAKAHLDALGLSPFVYLDRHCRNDWGDMSQTDKDLNDEAARSGEGRIFSSYLLPPDRKAKLWIITGADRSVTTIMLPSDY